MQTMYVSTPYARHIAQRSYHSGRSGRSFQTQNRGWSAHGRRADASQAPPMLAPGQDRSIGARPPVVEHRRQRITSEPVLGLRRVSAKSQRSYARGAGDKHVCTHTYGATRTVPKSLLSICLVAVVTSPGTAAWRGSVAEPDTLMSAPFVHRIVAASYISAPDVSLRPMKQNTSAGSRPLTWKVRPRYVRPRPHACNCAVQPTHLEGPGQGM